MEQLKELGFRAKISELNIAAKLKNISPNVLGIHSKQKYAAADERLLASEIESFPKIRKSLFEQYLKTLCVPKEQINLHIAYSQKSVSRSFLARDTDASGTYVEMLKIGRQYDIRETTKNVQFYNVLEALSSKNMTDPDFSFVLSLQGVFCFLASAELYKRKELIALLNHKAPSTLLSNDAILERLKEESSGDFRWPLSFYESILPKPILETFNKDDVKKGVDDLVASQIMELASGSVFEPTLKGDWLLSEFAIRVENMVALSHAKIDEDNKPGYNFYLFVKTHQNLYMIKQSGDEALIMSLSQENLEIVVNDIFS